MRITIATYKKQFHRVFKAVLVLGTKRYGVFMKRYYDRHPHPRKYFRGKYVFGIFRGHSDLEIHTRGWFHGVSFMHQTHAPQIHNAQGINAGAFAPVGHAPQFVHVPPDMLHPIGHVNAPQAVLQHGIDMVNANPDEHI